MKISQLCKMIEDSIQDGKYQLDDQQKHFKDSVQVINRSDSDDLKNGEIKIDVRIHDLYTISNYLPSVQHLPGVIEIDILDSFKMLCRRLGRIVNNPGDDSKGTTIYTDKLHLSEGQEEDFLTKEIKSWKRFAYSLVYKKKLFQNMLNDLYNGYAVAINPEGQITNRIASYVVLLQSKNGRKLDMFLLLCVMKRSNRFQQSTNSSENNAMLQLRIEGEPLEAGQILKSITTDYYQKHSKERCSCDTLYAFFSDRENRPKNSKTIDFESKNQ